MDADADTDIQFDAQGKAWLVMYDTDDGHAKYFRYPFADLVAVEAEDADFTSRSDSHFYKEQTNVPF